MKIPGCAAWLLLCGAVAGCGSGGSNSGGGAPAEVYGDWRLTRISGGLTGEDRFPTDEYRISIRHDGRLIVTMNSGGGPQERRFRVTRGNACLGDKALPILDFTSDSQIDQAVVEASPSRLVLADACISDGYTETFSRVP